MKILFDHQVYTVANYGGVSRYFYAMSKELPEHFNVDVENSVRLSNNIYTKDPAYNCHTFSPNFAFKGRSFIIKAINELSSKNQLRKNYDVFHPTYYDTYFLNTIKKKPFVLTFHDLIHEKYQNTFPDLGVDNGLFERRKILLERSTKIIAVSNNTKSDIVEHYKVAPEKIEVIYLANSLVGAGSPMPPHLKDYILFVGNRNGYKNFDFFIKAIAPLLEKEKSLIILCAGGGAFNVSEVNLFRSLKLTQQLRQIDIDDKLLITLYKNAQFFVFPSLYEGFGIPILEAFACSCPSVLSNTSSLAEIGGNAALFFNPSDENDILDKVTSILYDTELRSGLTKKALERQKLFSWYKTAKNHYEIYNSVS